MTDQNDNQPKSDRPSGPGRSKREAADDERRNEAASASEPSRTEPEKTDTPEQDTAGATASDADGKASGDDASQANNSARTKTDADAAGSRDAESPEADASATRAGGAGGGRRKPPSASRRAPAWLWPALCLLLLILLLAAGYWAYQQYRQIAGEWRQVASRQSELDQRMDSFSSQLERFSSQLDQAQQARRSLDRELRDELQSIEQMMVDTAQRLNRRQDLEANRWPLEEALALLRLAERRLQLDQNTEVALRLLDAADQILAGLDQAAVLPVRRQIAKDRLALQSVQTADINGLYFRLDAVAEYLAERELTPQQQVEPQPQEAPLPPWEAFKENLSSLVTITRLETPYEAPPLLSDFAQWQQHARLLVEQVQTALLARNQALFDAALRQLIDHVARMRQQLELAPALDGLRQMRDARLNPELPDIHGSTEALEDYISRVESEAGSESDAGEEAEAPANESSANDAAN